MDKVQDTDNKTLELLCRRSLEQYQEMVAMLQSLQGNLQDRSANNVNQFNVTFAALQNKIRHTDLEVTQHSKSQLDCDNITIFWDRRQELQLEMLSLIGETVAKASSVKSFLANEMQVVKQGKKALSGYKSQQDQYGRIVNKAF